MKWRQGAHLRSESATTTLLSLAATQFLDGVTYCRRTDRWWRTVRREAHCATSPASGSRGEVCRGRTVSHGPTERGTCTLPLPPSALSWLPRRRVVFVVVSWKTGNRATRWSPTWRWIWRPAAALRRPSATSRARWFESRPRTERNSADEPNRHWSWSPLR